jgi:SsrA-binding protein
MERSKQREIKVITSNRKAYFQYFLLDTYKAGIVLSGTEVKSMRAGKVSLSDAYCYFKNGELWLKNVHIAEYLNGGYQNHVPKRERKLLMQKRELQRLEAKLKERGYTIVPISLFFNERNLVKVEIALSKGKKSFDKRHTIKDRDAKRDMARNVRY